MGGAAGGGPTDVWAAAATYAVKLRHHRGGLPFNEWRAVRRRRPMAAATAEGGGGGGAVNDDGGDVDGADDDALGQRWLDGRWAAQSGALLEQARRNLRPSKPARCESAAIVASRIGCNLRVATRASFQNVAIRASRSVARCARCKSVAIRARCNPSSRRA